MSVTGPGCTDNNYNSIDYVFKKEKVNQTVNSMLIERYPSDVQGLIFYINSFIYKAILYWRLSWARCLYNDK